MQRMSAPIADSYRRREASIAGSATCAWTDSTITAPGSTIVLERITMVDSLSSASHRSSTWSQFRSLSSIVSAFYHMPLQAFLALTSVPFARLGFVIEARADRTVINPETGEEVMTGWLRFIFYLLSILAAITFCGTIGLLLQI